MAENSDLLNELSTFDINVKDSTVLRKCTELLTKHQFTPETFTESLMAFSISNKRSVDPLTLDILDQFDKFSSRKETKPIKREDLDDSLIIHNITTINQIAEEDDLLGSYGTPIRKNSTSKRGSTLEGTPQNKRLAGIGGSSVAAGIFSPSTLTSPTTPSAQKYASRSNSGDVVAKYPAGESPQLSWDRSGRPDATVRIVPVGPEGSDLLKADGKYMFGRLREKHRILEKHIDDIGDRLAQTLNINEWTANHSIQSAPFDTIGRICCDATSGMSAKLNPSSLLLQGSNETSSGVTVPLDVAQVREYSLFPGQVVAVEATNPTGSRLIATSIKQPVVEPAREIHLDGPGPLNLLVACGPFCLADELDYSPLQDLVRQINTTNPHVAILTGPFLDSRNKKVESGDLEGRTYEKEFDRLIRGLNQSIVASVQVVLVPSWRDAHHQVVYPTAPFKIAGLGNNFHLASDPCLLRISGVTVAVTSTDVLLHLGKEEISLNASGSDRMGRLVSHILSQKSFYPLYPPAEELSLDLQRWADFSQLSSTPQLLVVPSDLRHFVKNVDGCVAVNPERTVKGSSAGTFARIQVREDGQVRAEIVRI